MRPILAHRLIRREQQSQPVRQGRDTRAPPGPHQHGSGSHGVLTGPGHGAGSCVGQCMAAEPLGCRVPPGSLGDVIRDVGYGYAVGD